MKLLTLCNACTRTGKSRLPTISGTSLLVCCRKLVILLPVCVSIHSYSPPADARWEIDDLEKQYASKRTTSQIQKQEQSQNIIQFRQILSNLEEGLQSRDSAHSTFSPNPVAGPSSSSSPSIHRDRAERDGPSMTHEQVQAQMMAEQDYALDRFAETVGEIGRMSREIGVELEDQNR